MIRSYWRKAHFLIALISSLFLIITSVTGVILSFEPVSNRLNESHIGNADNSTVGSLIEKLESNYSEIIELKIDENQLLQVSILDEEGEFKTFLADPNTGKKVSDLNEDSSFFTFSRAFHRSLFYGTIGRLTIGITSFLLFFIALTGLILVVQRQLGAKNFFSKVNKINFHQYWHIVIGRWSLPLLIIVSLTGVFLSLDRFELFPEQEEIEHVIDFDSMSDTPAIDKRDFKLFENTQLSELEWVQFPFSPDIEDYYHIRLTDRELIVNQFNGKVISEVPFDGWLKMKGFVFNLHTGKTSAIWSVVLGLASLSILFFVFTGFKMALSRRIRRGNNRFSKDECSIVLLTGSEGGQTSRRANEVYDQLIHQGIKVYHDELNNYQVYEQMEHLLVFTSTYGDGQAPSNASKFLEKCKSISQPENFTFSVVGFGSTNYLQFCKYAQDVQDLLTEYANEKTPFTKINNQSLVELNAWRKKWTVEMNIILSEFGQTDNHEVEGIRDFEVISNYAQNRAPGNSFQLLLSSPSEEYRSGDLLAIRPSSGEEERCYSIGKNRNNELYLSIKLHDKGMCSTYLSRCVEGERIQGRILENKNFHFPKGAKKVICISNGTGIVPFIGMANENTGKNRFDLYWGGKSQKDLDAYQEEIEHVQDLGQLSSFQFTFSREGEKNYKYVQDLISGDKYSIGQSLLNGAIILICGSVAMQNDVLKILNEICSKSSGKSIEFYQNNGQLRVDCY